ncbi:unnamed protein product [Orchesella dallaii]|uniref:Uncharacterized protein n=1 Tax=Orchesella dallaii TaxID=48710 RepID=A0ABP1S1M6_9HEXA
MRCRGDDHFIIMELEKEIKATNDFLSISRSSNVLRKISIHILENIGIPMKLEKIHLEEKIGILKALSKSISTHDSSVTAVIDNASITSKIETISRLTKMAEEVNHLANTFIKRLDVMYISWMKTDVKWQSEEPKKSQVDKMTTKERKSLIKLWKEKEQIALEGKTELEDLKAEWDAEKGRLDEVIMDCLRGVAELKE